MTDDAAPITQVGTTVLIRGAALPLLYRATLALVAVDTATACASPLLQQAVTTLHRACLSSQRHEIDRSPIAGSSCSGQDGSPISVAEAADLLGLSRRQTQRRAATGIGVRLSRSIWALDQRAVLALADERKATAR